MERYINFDIQVSRVTATTPLVHSQSNTGSDTEADLLAVRVQLHRNERRDALRQRSRHADVLQAAQIRLPNPDHPPLPSFRPVHHPELQLARIHGEEGGGGEEQVIPRHQLEHDEPEVGVEEQLGEDRRKLRRT